MAGDDHGEEQDGQEDRYELPTLDELDELLAAGKDVELQSEEEIDEAVAPVEEVPPLDSPLEIPEELTIKPVPEPVSPTLADTVLADGLMLDSEGRLRSDDIASSIGDVGQLATRRLLAPHIESILNRSIEAYQDLGGADAQLQELQWTKERYEAGDRIDIQGLAFYDPDRGEQEDVNIITVPAINNAANIIQLLGIPASIIAPVTGNKYAIALANASVHVPSGMKSLLKFYKELRKKKKKPFRIARYGITGLGAILYGLPTSFGWGPIHKYVYRPLTTAYLINQGLFALKMLPPDKVKHEIPELDIIREDLRTQVLRYHAVKRKYRGQPIAEVTKDNIEERINHVNRFLGHHLEKISLGDIDIEYDYSIAKVMGALVRADIQHDTCELTPGVLPGQDPLFSWAYAHECMHLDGTKNEGKANFRADRVLEDMAVHYPDEGYDLMLEEMRFAAIGHSFAAKLMDKAYTALHEFAKECDERASYTERQRLVKTMVYNELRDMDLTFEDVRTIWTWAYPGTMRKGLFRVQSILGSDPRGGSTLDYYKLLHEEEIL